MKSKSETHVLETIKSKHVYNRTEMKKVCIKHVGKKNRNITPVLDLESLISIIVNNNGVESRPKSSLICQLINLHFWHRLVRLHGDQR